MSYEAMRLNDEFGRRMCRNVREQRGTPFLALEEENGRHDRFPFRDRKRCS